MFNFSIQFNCENLEKVEELFDKLQEILSLVQKQRGEISSLPQETALLSSEQKEVPPPPQETALSLSEQKEVPPSPQETALSLSEQKEEELDKDGLPYDPTIHTSGENKLTKDGKWKLKRGVDPKLVMKVRADYLQKKQILLHGDPVQKLIEEITKRIGAGETTVLSVMNELNKINIPNLDYLKNAKDPNLIKLARFVLEQLWEQTDA